MQGQQTADSNMCEICGGVLKIEYTMTFEQCRPLSLRVEPTSPPYLCPGHTVESSNTRDWHKLNVEQQYDVDQLRRQIADYLIEQTKAFYVQHPELRLTWSTTLDALIRGET